MEATVLDSYGTRIRSRVINLSESGCGVELSNWTRLETSRAYCIKFGGLEVQAGIASWSKSGEVGFKFINPISSYVIEHLLAAYGVAADGAN